MKRTPRWSVALMVVCGSTTLLNGCGGLPELTYSEKQQPDPEPTSPEGGGESGGTNLPIPGIPEDEVKALIIEPATATVDAAGNPATFQFKAVYDNGATPKDVNWSIDDVVVGTIEPTGEFVSPGFVSGTATVTAQVGDLTATATVTVRVNITENFAGLTAEEQNALIAGGPVSDGFQWLYPYDGTVFPRGLPAPAFMFGSQTSDATYIRISIGDHFKYENFYLGSTPVRAAVSEQVWKAITQSAKATDIVEVEATKLEDGVASGPVEQEWRIAQGSLKGLIYYNTYDSDAIQNGAIMRIKPGSSAEVVAGSQDECVVCHSVSAQGNVMVAGADWNDNPVDSRSFSLASDGTLTTQVNDPDGRKFPFGAVTPDGTWVLSSGIPNWYSGEAERGHRIWGLRGDHPSKLFETATGAEIPFLSVSPVNYAVTPSFSPLGDNVAFHWFNETTQQTSLALMSFDGTVSPPQFGSPTQLAAHASKILAWPSFTPGGEAVVYHEGDTYDTSYYRQDDPANMPAYANVRMVDVDTKELISLDALNGRTDAGTYLPYGDEEEGNVNYEPTVLPAPAGGYYWVIFTSRRTYGNMIAPGGTVPGGDNKWFDGDVDTPSPRKKIWVAAVDVDFAGKIDPSHPAFYLPGQELNAGNMRAFAALEPCKSDGMTCESAAECCNGFCREDGKNPDGTPHLVCKPPESGCSNEDEACETSADCCEADQGHRCINNRCAQPTPR